MASTKKVAVAKKVEAMKKPAAKKPQAFKKPSANEKATDMRVVFNEDLMECRSGYLDMVDYNRSFKCQRACTWKEQLAFSIGSALMINSFSHHRDLAPLW